LARLGNDRRYRRLIGGSHDVDAGDTLDARKLLDEIEANAATLGGRIGRRFKAADEPIGNDGTGQVMEHPARRFC